MTFPSVIVRIFCRQNRGSARVDHGRYPVDDPERFSSFASLRPCGNVPSASPSGNLASEFGFHPRTTLLSLLLKPLQHKNMNYIVTHEFVKGIMFNAR